MKTDECSHGVVVLGAEPADGGGYDSVWRCEYCGAEFVMRQRKFTEPHVAPSAGRIEKSIGALSSSNGGQ